MTDPWYFHTDVSPAEEEAVMTHRRPAMTVEEDAVMAAARRLVAHWSRRAERSIAYAEAGERAKAMLIHAVRNATRPASSPTPTGDGHGQ